MCCCKQKVFFSFKAQWYSIVCVFFPHPGPFPPIYWGSSTVPCKLGKHQQATFFIASYNLFLNSFIQWWTLGVLVLVIMTNTAINKGMQISSFLAYRFHFIGMIKSDGTSIFKVFFWRTFKLLFKTLPHKEKSFIFYMFLPLIFSQPTKPYASRCIHFLTH